MHDVDNTTTRNFDHDKAWPPNTPYTQEAEGDSHQLTPTPENNTRRFGEQMHNSKEHRFAHEDTLHQPQNKNSLGDTRRNTAHMVFEGEFAVKLYAKGVEVWTNANRIPQKKTKSSWGWFTVLDLFTLKP